jgi:predicted RNase H-like nuclease
MVDVPIGLPPEGTRQCDLEARDLLKKDCSRVFLGVRRGLLQFEGSDHPTANSWAKSNGKGISLQLFNLRRKLAEVDHHIPFFTKPYDPKAIVAGIRASLDNEQNH